MRMIVLSLRTCVPRQTNKPLRHLEGREVTFQAFICFVWASECRGTEGTSDHTPQSRSQESFVSICGFIELQRIGIIFIQTVVLL
ncbi:uncharacterized [Tachysurus ichikawai]